MRDAVERRLHAARAARLERLARVVQPDVAALHEEMRDVQVVVVDERDAAAEQRIERASVDALQMMLADVVGRVRLAGEDDLHRPARGVEDPREPFGVVEHELRPLVAGEAAREADRQRSGSSSVPAATTRGDADVLFGPALARALADEREQVAPQRLADTPTAPRQESRAPRPTAPGSS